MDGDPRTGVSFLVAIADRRCHRVSASRTLESELLQIEKGEGSETILLVEDDEAVRAVAQRSLARFGYDVVPVARGVDAVRIAKEFDGRIHLLLTDIMMPGMNGVEVASAIAKLRPGIHIFFMSGYADQDLVRQGLLEPGTHFLQKPFTPQELAERVRRIIDGE
ncbi:MAG: response regulator [Gemmatimonadales bacterium]|nr:MAG: response regulator [Gemmatimonadales bacterium]